MPAESPGVRAALCRAIRALYGLHLSYLQHAVRHLRPLRTMNGGLVPPLCRRPGAIPARRIFATRWIPKAVAAYYARGARHAAHGITRNSTPATAIFHLPSSTSGILSQNFTVPESGCGQTAFASHVRLPLHAEERGDWHVCNPNRRSAVLLPGRVLHRDRDRGCQSTWLKLTVLARIGRTR